MNTPHTPHSPHTGDDDELGAALGDSIRRRVDAIPTITPGFDGVERRARQITTRRRALAGAAVAAFLLLGGVGIASLAGDDTAVDQDTVDQPDDSAPPDDAAPPDDSPADDSPTQDHTVTGLIDGSRFVRVGPDGIETELYAAGPGEFLAEALALADGSFLLEVHPTPNDYAGIVRHHEVDGTVTVLSDFGDLAGGAVLDGVPLAFVGDVPDFSGGLPPDDATTGDLRRVDLRTHESSVFVADAYGLESAVDHVGVHNRLVLVAAGSEGGPWWTVRDVDGNDLDFPMPLDRSEILPEGDAQVYAAHFDAEGDGIWYLRQDFAAGTWSLDGANFDGSEPRSFALPIAADSGHRLDLEIDGDQLVVNVAPATDEGITTFWIQSSLSAETEPGYVNFVQAPQFSPLTRATTTTEPTAVPEDPVDASLPPLLIADGGSIVRWSTTDGRLESSPVVERTERPATHLHQAANGDVFVREVLVDADGAAVESFVRYRSDGGRDELDVAGIFDVAVIAGIESVIVALPAVDDIGFGGLQAWAVDDLRVVADLGLGAEAEFGVTHFHWSEAAGVGVATAWSDLTEWIGFVDAAGAPVELPSPTDDLGYNAPPFVTAATISPDGTTRYWAEGPDWGFDPATNESGPMADSWELRGADLATGEIVLQMTLGEPVLDSSVLAVHSILAFDDHIVINRTTGGGALPAALAPWVIDLTGDEPVLQEYPATGIATAPAR